MTTTRVIGIGYELDEAAPTVVLKGAGAEAEAVLARARQSGDVRIVRDAALAEQLYRVPIDAPIGRELFPVMAVLLAEVLELDTDERMLNNV
jgi:type III secretion system FlhB-like substrate exporter